jgi:hypothetical protein
MCTAPGLKRPRRAEPGVQYESGKKYQGRRVAKRFPGNLHTSCAIIKLICVAHIDHNHPHGIWVGVVAGVTQNRDSGELVFGITFPGNGGKESLTENEVCVLRDC